MYEQFYGLKAKPFALTPDPNFLFPSRQHAMALSLLEYGLETQAVFGLLTGDIGSGKTTLLRHVLRSLDERVAVGLISNTHRGFQSVQRWALSALSIVPADDSDIAMYEALVDSFVREYARGRRTLLVIDEAQNLTVDLLEELRLLSNANSESDVVLQVLLVGQPELRATLALPQMRQLAQRISVDFHLRPLSREETGAYVRHRLRAAGTERRIFLEDALDVIYQRTGGVPRVVNQLCDVALVYGFADGKSEIGTDVLAQVFSDRAGFDALPLFAADSAPRTAARAATRVRRPLR
jgi:type II secretory pathway predicted ATPase ExeA